MPCRTAHRSTGPAHGHDESRGTLGHGPPAAGFGLPCVYACEGTSAIDGDRITVSLTTAECDHPSGTVIFTARWRIEDHDPRFVDVTSDVDGDAFAQAFWGGSTWIRIK
jgi:hypothetical protein